MSLFDKLKHLGATVAADLAAAHTRTQALRFLRLAVFTMLAQVVATGGDNLGWKTLAAFAVGAAETAVRHVWPAFPAAAVVNAVKGAVSSTPAAVSSGGGYASSSAMTVLTPPASVSSVTSTSSSNASAAAPPSGS